MLQQTRVDTVIDYFVRWMAKWPTLPDLAQAPLDDVLAQWTGLGYYNRARNLHAAAFAVMSRHNGVMPSDAASLQALPGLGPYTVGAIRSIAFAQPAALVDGNVARVLARWHAVIGDPASTAGKKAIWALADGEMREPTAQNQPSNWNQALMELGATVCLPKQPKCQQCPVSADCLARQQGLQGQIPPVKIRKESPTVAACYALLLRVDDGGVRDSDGGEILLGQRPATGRWAGLWEPPGMEGSGSHRAMQQWLRALGVVDQLEMQPVVHILTHRRYEATSIQAHCHLQMPPDLTALGYVQTRWLPVDRALSQTGGLSRLAQRLIEQLDCHPVVQMPLLLL